jgi:hypothetical protein
MVTSKILEESLTFLWRSVSVGSQATRQSPEELAGVGCWNLGKVLT